MPKRPRDDHEAAAAAADEEDEELEDPSVLEPHAVFDKEAVLAVLTAIEPSPPLDWIERLDVTSATPIEVEDVEDDLEREKSL